MIKKIRLFLLALLISTNALAALKVGDSIQEATLFGLNTASTKLSKYAGKPIIINFWASWCGPCIAEMQSLNNIADNPHYTIIGISTDDDASAAIQLINQQQLKFHNYIDDKMKLEKTFGANSIPLTVFINKHGKIIKIIRGSQAWDNQQNTMLIKRLFNLSED